MRDLVTLAIEVDGLSGLPGEAFSEVFPHKLVNHGLTLVYHRLLDDSECSKFVTAPCTRNDVVLIGRIAPANSDRRVT